MIREPGRHHNAPRHLRRDHDITDPIRSVLLKASDGKRSPRVDLAIREENMGRVHIPPAVDTVDGIDVRLRGDRSLREKIQADLLDGRLAQELRLNASVVVGISTLEETYRRAYNQIRLRTHVGEGVKHTEFSAILVMPRKCVCKLSVWRSSDGESARVCLSDTNKESLQNNCDVEMSSQALRVSGPLPVPCLHDITERQDWRDSVVLSMSG